MPRTRRLPTPAPPTERGVHGDLAYTLWLPEGTPWGGLVVIHGAMSSKESHHDMARAARTAGMAAVAFDLRGHGETGGRLDGRVFEDVAAIAGLLGDVPIAVRGSSLGGYVAIAAAERVGAAAIVAVCPAPGHGLAAGLRSGRLTVPVDLEAVEALLSEHDLGLIVEQSAVPLLLIHAEGDEQVPAQHSVELHARSAAPLKRLIVTPGGHHRTAQHDAELQGESIRFIRRALGASSFS
ncbi:MAG: alpha/beta hydrolase [Solirubrobacteraceae bacterium]